MNQISATARIGENCKLGDNVILHEYVVLYPGTVIGDNTEIFDGAIIGRPPKSAGNTVHKIGSDFKPVTIGSNCVIGVGAVIYADNLLGDHVLIGDGAKLREGGVIEDYVLIAMNCTLNHHVTVKKGSKVMDLTHITARTIIEEDVFVGVNVTTVNDNAMRLRGQEVGAASTMIMKTGCKIGSSATLLPGVVIGENAIVGAGALVTKNVADGVRVMGVPAKER